MLFAIGVAGSSAFDSVAEAKLARGESMRIGDYTLVYRSLDERETSNATEIRATLDVRRGDRDLGTLEAGKNAYTIEQQVSNEVGIRSDKLTGEDLFVIAEQIDPDGTRLLPGLRQAARQPHLARRARLPPRLGDHAVARPPRAASARRARLDGRPSRDALTLALVLAAALAVACVVVVALPFLREPEPESDSLDELDEAERRRLELLEARDRALAALKELEFDHRTGTVSDEDYRSQVGVLRRDVAGALQALERDSGEGRPAGGRN